MATHPAVALAAAVGMPDAYAGELPVCCVALRSGASVSEDELRDHAQATIGERIEAAQAQALEDGRRGMRLSAVLPLAALLFKAEVSVA